MTKAEFSRIYGSEERVLFVKTLPCCACGRFPSHDHPSENHHTENGGLSRKAGYLSIVPLCAPCHRLIHQIGKKSFVARYGVSFPAAAIFTQAAWARHQLDHGKFAA